MEYPHKLQLFNGLARILDTIKSRSKISASLMNQNNRQNISTETIIETVNSALDLGILKPRLKEPNNMKPGHFLKFPQIGY